MIRLRQFRHGLVAAGLVALAACGSTEPTPTLPGTNPEVTNATDNFQLQTSNVQNATGTYEYTWRNNGTQANVNQSTTINSGAIELVVLDANGAQVYSRTLADNGTYQTTAGASGNWTIRLTFTGGTGTVNFRVQRAN